jgi:hypothetical protein
LDGCGLSDSITFGDSQVKPLTPVKRDAAQFPPLGKRKLVIKKPSTRSSMRLSAVEKLPSITLRAEPYPIKDIVSNYLRVYMIPHGGSDIPPDTYIKLPEIVKDEAPQFYEFRFSGHRDLELAQGSELRHRKALYDYDLSNPTNDASLGIDLDNSTEAQIINARKIFLQDDLLKRLHGVVKLIATFRRVYDIGSPVQVQPIDDYKILKLANAPMPQQPDADSDIFTALPNIDIESPELDADVHTTDDPDQNDAELKVS